MIVLIIILFAYQKLVEAEGVHWDLMHQDDYDVIPHRIEVIYANESYVKLNKCELVKYNRTSLRTLNASGTLIKSLDKKGLVAKVQIYKFYTNTYKYFPITADLNLCQEYERNSFDIKTSVNLYSNVRSCPPKPGFISVTHAPVVSDKTPPFMPKGDYKFKIEMFNRDDKLGHLEAYASIVEKPRKWK